MALLVRSLTRSASVSKSCILRSNIRIQPSTLILRKTKNSQILSFSQKSDMKSDPGEKDRIFTIPNLLCVGRIAASPYLAHTIINGDLKTSFFVFGLASFSDLVRIF